MNWNRRLRMYYNNHRITILIVVIVLALLIFSIMGLNSLESFYRKVTIAQLPITMLMGVINTVIFVAMYLLIFRDGFSQMDTKKVKTTEVKVTFNDVIGIDQAKEE